MEKINFDVLIPAHGESINQLENLVFAITMQRTKQFKLGKILLCSNNTKIEDYFNDKSIIQFIKQSSRLGKPDAFNRMLHESDAEFCVSESADTIPASQYTYQFALTPLINENVGAVTSNPIPINWGFLHLPFIIWRCHHFVQPKISGEMFAFRRELLDKIPLEIVHDDTYIHQIIATKGFKIIYEPRALVINRVSDSLGEFYSQRVKNVVGNLQIKEKFGCSPSDKMRFRLLVLMSVELLANVHGRLDYVRGKIPRGLIGYSLGTTKEVIKNG